MQSDVTIFAEKPSQARAYADAYNIKNKTKSYIELHPCSTFPNGAVITWGIGHLIELKSPVEYDEKYKNWDLAHLPIIPNFEYKIKKSVRNHYLEIEKILKSTNSIILATDREREGELIGRLVFEHAGVMNKPMMRMFPVSEVEESVRESFNNLKPIHESDNMYEEAKARQHADWLVGMNLSPLYTLLLQQKGFRGSLGIGRVQCPTVKIIYDRQKEIENFVSTPFYQLKSMFQSSNGEYEGISDVKVNTKDEMKAILQKYGFSKNDVGVVKSVTKKEKRNYAPNLHSISSLQIKANKMWKYSSNNTLKTVQSLYEKKLVSYPRTDCTFIGDKEFEYLVQHVEDYKRLAGVQFETYSTEPNNRYVDSSRVGDHYALIPTQKIPSESVLNNLTEMEKNIYNEILITTLGMFHRDYIYEETVIITDIKGLEFKTKGRIEKDKGWHEISLEKKKTKNKVLPNINQGEQVQAELNVEEGKTSPPKPYTEGQLVRLMETAGKFVEEEDGEQLEEIKGIGTGATRAGIIERIKEQKYIEIKKNIVRVTKKGEILCEAIEGTLLASPTMTAKWETYLKRIGNGSGDRDTFIQNIIKFINKSLTEVPNSITQNVINLIQQEEESGNIAKCPACGDGYITEKKSKKNRKFYGCTGYSNGCTMLLPGKIAGKNITKTIVKDLCGKGKTGKLKGFKNKAGKSFETKLYLNTNNEIKFY